MRGNAVHLSGPIDNLRCILHVFCGRPEAKSDDGIDPAMLVAVPALIDTGATGCCISHELAKRLELVPHGKSQVGVVGGTTELNVAPMLVCFVNPDGRHIHKMIPTSIGDIAVPMLFGMSELAPGVLTVDFTAGTWDWKVPNRTIARPTVLAQAEAQSQQGTGVAGSHSATP